ncbi:MAG: UDP-N-acetylglucosamine 2-epimerase (hydrolyzing) [Ruminococcus sp.]|nr:UDP-N-acetylglucosamine 2-epimerase (hydrolyzing) [Ruminococcus sp.]
MKKIAVVTATRAEYGLLTPLIRAIYQEPELELELIVTGMHLSEKYGYTKNAIENDGFPIAYEIPILDEDNSPRGISYTMASALKQFADCFKTSRPDILVILGDRTEMLAVAIAAMNECIPIAHIAGGEITEGAVDDCIRHSITKMSYLHFTTAEPYRKRVIQLGEEPQRVFNVGSLSSENILKAPLKSEEAIRSNIGIPLDLPYAVVTFHPVTLEADSAKEQALELCKAMRQKNEYYYLITYSNSDASGDVVNRILSDFAKSNKNASIVKSLGLVRYLSAVKYAKFVLGNSSSGIVEAPVLGTPTVNIGMRQSGRLMAETIVNCAPNANSIIKAIEGAEKIKHTPVYLYGNGETSAHIVAVLKEYLNNGKIDLKKTFYDLQACP